MPPLRLVESLSHRQRELTPARLATWLVGQVRLRCGTYTVAVLWTHKDSHYATMAGVECYDLARDAYSYRGPWPVICHPPCGPWGRYSAVSRQDKQAGLHALDLAALYGGVVEQPASSQLYRGGQVILQSNYGHLAEKATRLLWIDPPR